MWLVWVLALYITCFLQVNAQEPCTNVVTYGTDEPGLYRAVVTLNSEFTLSGIWLRLEFQSKVLTVTSTFDTEVVTEDNLSYLFRSPEFRIYPNNAVTIPLSVKYTEWDAPPRISSVKLNGRVLCPAPSETPRISPCPAVVLFTNSEFRKWEGILTVRSDVELQGVWVKVLLDTPADLLGSKFGEVKAKDNQGFVIFKREHILKPGQALEIPVFVRYSPLSAIPNVKRVRLNGRTICGALVEQTTPPNNQSIPLRPTVTDDDSGIQTISLGPTVTDLDSESQTISLGSMVTDLDSVEKPSSVAPLHVPQTKKVPSEPVIVPKFSCGLRELSDKIYFGATITIKQYPWHGAIFHSKQYACGMSLISPYHALSAAHCFYNFFKKPVDKSSVSLYFGLSSFQNMNSPEVQAVKVDQLFLHPEYRFHNPRHDIAVVKFDRPVECTDYIQPVCLWEEDAHLRSVAGKSGVVVGFGLTETGKMSNQLLWAKIKVVDSETCRDLNPNFYANFLSRSSYCAGNLNMSSVCIGDSGGGMYFQKCGKEIWQIRGIISTSKSRDSNCDTSHYTIFTDVAVHKDWIEEQMRK